MRRLYNAEILIVPPGCGNKMKVYFYFFFSESLRLKNFSYALLYPDVLCFLILSSYAIVELPIAF